MLRRKVDVKEAKVERGNRDTVEKLEVVVN